MTVELEERDPHGSPGFERDVKPGALQELRAVVAVLAGDDVRGFLVGLAVDAPLGHGLPGVERAGALVRDLLRASEGDCSGEDKETECGAPHGKPPLVD